MENSQKILQSIIMFGFFILSSANPTAYNGPTTTAGLNVIKNFECFRPVFYTTDPGVKIIGYGYNCQTNQCDNLRPPLTIAQATNLLKTQVKPFEKCVNELVKYVQLNAAQFSALVSLTFDLGCGSLKTSILLNKLNKNDVSGAATELTKLNKVGSKVMPGLTIKRAAQRDLFCSNKVC